MTLIFLLHFKPNGDKFALLQKRPHKLFEPQTEINNEQGEDQVFCFSYLRVPAETKSSPDGSKSVI